MKVRAALFCLVLLGATALDSANAQFNAIRQGMHDARTRGDWKTFKAGAVRLVQFLNGSPDALVDLARAQVHIGDVQSALGTLKTVALMGQFPDAVETLEDFGPVRHSAGFAAVLGRMKAGTTPETHATIVVDVPDAGFLPDDIDYDPSKRGFYLSSVLEKKVSFITETGRLTTFAKSPDGWPMFALKVDRRDGIIWATESAIDGFASVPKAEWGHSALLAYDYASGKLIERTQCPRPCNLGDMALDPTGGVLVSDSAGGRLYHCRPNCRALLRIDHGDFLSPQTPAYLSAGLALVPDYLRGVGLLDLSTGDVRWFPMNGEFALEGIDGMYLYHHRLIVVQNGTMPERITSFTLMTNYYKVAAEKVLERGVPDLDPTHGVVVGRDFYFIENAGWNALTDEGVVRPGASLTRSRIMVTHL